LGWIFFRVVGIDVCVDPERLHPPRVLLPAVLVGFKGCAGVVDRLAGGVEGRSGLGQLFMRLIKMMSGFSVGVKLGEAFPPFIGQNGPKKLECVHAVA
jgi:hypothetical protein